MTETIASSNAPRVVFHHEDWRRRTLSSVKEEEEEDHATVSLTSQSFESEDVEDKRDFRSTSPDENYVYHTSLARPTHAATSSEESSSCTNGPPSSFSLTPPTNNVSPAVSITSLLDLLTSWNPITVAFDSSYASKSKSKSDNSNTTASIGAISNIVENSGGATTATTTLTATLVSTMPAIKASKPLSAASSSSSAALMSRHRRKLAHNLRTRRAVAILKDRLLKRRAEYDDDISESCSISLVTNKEDQAADDPLSLREIVGDIGLTLFNPFDENVFLPPPQRLQENVKGGKKTGVGKGLSRVATSTTYAMYSHNDHDDDAEEAKKEEEDMFIFNHEVFPVQLVSEPLEDLKLSPRILTEDMFHQIVNEAIPRSLRIYKWERIFAISRDGDAFITMLERCSHYKNTLVVVRTTKGNILGGFASEYWKGQEGRHKQQSYFGTGHCFLFSDHPSTQSTDPEAQLNIYPWTGSNDYCQICDSERQYIAMGGGQGDFGLIIEESFLYGSTGRCATFSNPPLIPGIDGTFDVQELEVWGMVPLFPSVHKPLTKKYSDVSLLDDYEM